MPRPITNNVLAEKIDNLHSALANFKEDLNFCKAEIKENSQFRLQIKGFLTGLVAVSSMIGGLIMWVLTSIFNNGK